MDYVDRKGRLVNAENDLRAAGMEVEVINLPGVLKVISDLMYEAQSYAIEAQRKKAYAAATDFIESIQGFVSPQTLKGMSRIRHICYSTKLDAWTEG